MPRPKPSASKTYLAPALSPSTHEGLSDAASHISAELSGQVEKIAAYGITPSSALDLIARLIAEAPTAAQDRMELIKITDTLVKTARSMMETKLKHDDAEAIMNRLDDIEAQIDQLAREAVQGTPP
jgi:uncharacterized protein Yka (UPF0111/DUF47 family)